MLTAVLSLHPQSSKAGEEGAKELCEGHGRGEDGDANVAEDGTWEGENPKHLVGIFLKPKNPQIFLKPRNPKNLVGKNQTVPT